MKDLTSLPLSVRASLTAVENLTKDGHPEIAARVLAETLKSLANTNPEACAVILAAQMGFREMAGVQRTVSKTTTTTKHVRLGICIGKDVTTVTTENTIGRSLKLS